MNRISKPYHHWITLALLTLLSACASVPFDYPKTESSAVPASTSTKLGQLRFTWEQEHGEDSGFIALPDGIQALGARLTLIEAAESTIDAQYFILKKDRAGALFAGKLLRAADRGVRVRLLVDDIFTPGTDHAFSLLNTHPNVEVRLFNPMGSRTIKYWNYLTDFKRANRRMHNKSFTVDNSATIVGGRNIGEEYFELKQDVKFDDFEVFAIGAVVDEVSAGFDEFWSSELSVPMDAFGINVDAADLNAWREGMRDEISGKTGGIYQQSVNSTFIQNVREGLIKPRPAPAVMVTDHPDKLMAATGDTDQATLAMEIVRRFQAAESEIIIITPYFIPRDRGATLIEKLLASGIRVVIVTNSLASTNHVPVHSAYTRYRKRLLMAGAEIYEVNANIGNADANEWGLKPELVTLHSKATLIDGRTAFVGSLNFDPRSIVINTEMGLFIESTELTGPFRQQILDNLPQSTYRVELDENGKLRWILGREESEAIAYKEPNASWWRRQQARIYRILPESQL